MKDLNLEITEVQTIEQKLLKDINGGFIKLSLINWIKIMGSPFNSINKQYMA